MKNITQKISILVLLAALFTACDKNGGGDVNPETVTGKWIIQTIESNISFKNDTPQIQNKNISEQVLYFDFAEDGTYTTNAAVELGDISSNDGIITSGTYTRDGDIVGLEYTDPDLRIPVILYLTTIISGDEMSMGLEKKELIKAFGEATNLDAFTQAFLQIFLDEIVTFDFKITLKK